MQEESDLFLITAFAISRIWNFMHQVKGQIAYPQQEAGCTFSCTDYRERFWISELSQLPYKPFSVLPVRFNFFSASTQNNSSVQI